MPQYVEIHDHHGLEMQSTVAGDVQFTYTLPSDLQEHDIIVFFRPRPTQGSAVAPTSTPSLAGFTTFGTDVWAVDICSAAEASARAGVTYTLASGTSRADINPSGMQDTTADFFDAWVLRPVYWSDIFSITASTRTYTGSGSPGNGDENDGWVLDDEFNPISSVDRTGVFVSWGHYSHLNQHPDVINTPLGRLQPSATSPVLAEFQTAWLDGAPFTAEAQDDPWEFYSRTEHSAMSGVGLENPPLLDFIYNPWPEGVDPFGAWNAEGRRLTILINGVYEGPPETNSGYWGTLVSLA